jgi:hypothetical protein
MADKDVNEVIATLEDAASEAEESSTEAEVNEEESTEEVEAQEDDESGSKKTAPKGSKNAQGRIRELVETTKDLQSQLEAALSEKSERDQELGKLVNLLEEREEKSKTVDRIQYLYEHGSDEIKASIEQLDKAIVGKEIEGEVQEKKGEDSTETRAIQEALVSQKAVLEDQLAEQQTDLTLHKADLLADKYIQHLHEEFPDDYNEDDERIIRQNLVNYVDWDAIEENPESLQDNFHAGFEAVLTDYGTPRGSLIKKTQTDDENSEESKTKEEPFDLEEFANKEWGKLKQIGTDKHDRPIMKEVVSDEDFISMAAEGIRRENQGS